MKTVIVALSMGIATAVHAQSMDPRFIDQKHAAEITGEQTFTHVCQGCHMADAKGAVGAGHYPALASNPKLAAKAYPVVMVMNGRGGMPPFSMLLTDAQVADVVNYIRTHFGNHYADTVTAADVEPFRSTTPNRPRGHRP
ncbi:Cytochrome C oxidase, cbb3-type, subunit III [Luteibacter sp. UNCMF331Sha3.1]|uniref:c-type cytochrome n=1 Tax=Luteibacter sp. UNCMF331Sha3.1 TaxID=1502760 RepID=UPI0008CD9327|nr:cytochrome c [Luteibacter sp. UNCMF331Sha3.1]SEM31655.1 Cytochrome C oxidase, cbb3-type, subunit III [Luteibacter sp. UNCMF331Sha3.1]